MFRIPPSPSNVQNINGKYVGTLSDGSRVKIPGAFADWPPDDSQPPWGDVTYLRMYEHQDFNYIAYNTIRMYDSRLARPENVIRPLWERISGIIPFYQREFGIDGVMIDMGHALPSELKGEIIQRAREINQDFAFWDENFSITGRSREEGYNAVFGYLWWDQHHLPKMKAFVRRCASDGLPIPFFATPESHNTPRAAGRQGGTVYSKWSWVVNCFLPGIPFLHSGFELAETYPINTGLDFTVSELKKLPSERLPLFSEYSFEWDLKKQFASFVGDVARIRSKYQNLVTNPDPQSFAVIEQENEAIVAFARTSVSGRKRLALLGNGNFSKPERTEIHPGGRGRDVRDLLTRRVHRVRNGKLAVTLKPGQCVLFEF
jgi:hypothetical protein